MSAIEHAVPAYVPEARGQITHYVCYDYPKERGVSTVMSVEMPCTNPNDAIRIAAGNRACGMRNVRVLTWEEKHGVAVAGGRT